MRFADTGQTINAYTWSSGYSGGGLKHALEDGIDRIVENIKYEFVNDYLAANQKTDYDRYLEAKEKEKKPSIYDVIDKDDG